MKGDVLIMNEKYDFSNITFKQTCKILLISMIVVSFFVCCDNSSNNSNISNKNDACRSYSTSYSKCSYSALEKRCVCKLR